MAEVTITCLSCGNQVVLDQAQVAAAGAIRCHCGSTELDLAYPEPTSAELIAGFAGLSHWCPACGNTGWVRDQGTVLPCRRCQGGV